MRQLRGTSVRQDFFHTLHKSWERITLVNLRLMFYIYLLSFLSTLEKYYDITVDWSGSKYIGITLDWDYQNRALETSVPG